MKYSVNDLMSPFLDKIKAFLPPVENVNLHNLVKTYQTHSHSKSCRKYRKDKCRFNFGKFFSRDTLIAKPIDTSIHSEEEKNEILINRSVVLDKVETFINSFLNPFKEGFNPNLSIPEILEILNCPEETYYHYLMISPDEVM